MGDRRELWVLIAILVLVRVIGTGIAIVLCQQDEINLQEQR